ncbi:MAG: LptA/OstA family protein, partial [Verrucomicrobiota bacterium]
MRIWQLTFLIGALSLGPLVHAQMMPDAPVKNFRFPRFSEEGFTEWVLQGGEGIYDSEEQIRVNQMNLRVYSGDERLVQELGLKSPQATIRLQENRAFSESRILIEGTNFTISGTGWEWDGATKVVEVKDDAIVTFAQSMTNTLTGVSLEATSAGKTEIRSKQLLLKTTETEYEFIFIEDVKVLSGDMTLQSGRLVAVAETPEGRDTKDVAAVGSQIDALRSLKASEQVVIRQSDKVARAEKAVFDPATGQVDLIGLPQIEASGAFISGHHVRSQRGQLLIKGSEGAGRAQVILTRAGGFG